MQQDATGISRAALMASLRERNCPVTAHQLVRWHKQGLLPRPRRRHHGRGRGTETIYPAGVETQAYALYQILKIDRNLESATWTLWLNGFPVTPLIRRRIRSGLTDIIREAEAQLVAFENDNPDNVIDQAETAHLPPSSNRLRKHIGRNDFPFVIRAVVEFLAGRQEAIYTPDESAQLALQNTIQFFAGDIQNRNSLPPAQLFVELQKHVHEFFPVTFLSALDATSDSQLETLRRQMILLWDLPQRLAGMSLSPLPYAVFVFAFVIRFGIPSARDFIDDLIRTSKESLEQLIDRVVASHQFSIS